MSEPIGTDERLDRIKELEAKLSKSEALLAKALGELKVFTDLSTYMQASASYNKRKHESSITDTIWSQWSRQLKYARTIVAELKGEDRG
jgi:hypothetical protein